MEQCWQLGQRSPLKIKQPDVRLGACSRSPNLRQGCGAPLTPALGTRAGDTVDKTLPRNPGPQWGQLPPTSSKQLPSGAGSLQHWGLVSVTSSGSCSWDAWVTLVPPSVGLQVPMLAQAVGAATPPLQRDTGVQNPRGGSLGCQPLM